MTAGWAFRVATRPVVLTSVEVDAHLKQHLSQFQRRSVDLDLGTLGASIAELEKDLQLVSYRQRRQMRDAGLRDPGKAAAKILDKLKPELLAERRAIAETRASETVKTALGAQGSADVAKRVTTLATEIDASRAALRETRSALASAAKGDAEQVDAAREATRAEASRLGDTVREAVEKRLGEMSLGHGVGYQSQVRQLVKDLTPDAYLEDLVDEAIEKHASDRTGECDYAFQARVTSGDSLPDRGCGPGGFFPCLFSPAQRNNPPSIIVRPGSNPTECWAMRGSIGFFTIELKEPVRLSAISLEHISASIAPNYASAPRRFLLYARLRDVDEKWAVLGDFEYRATTNFSVPTVQTFGVTAPASESEKSETGYPLPREPAVFDTIRVQILSNYGDEKYTCIYRVRVKGEAQTSGADVDVDSRNAMLKRVIRTSVMLRP